jgi:hypothetical protein
VNVFFFRHPLATDEWVGAPGRYAFDVTGPALVRDGHLFRRTAWTGRIYADGKSERTPSTNMDPHVLSDVLPAFLSFCRIDKLGTNDKNVVQHVGSCAHEPGPRLLSEVVTAGDVILFGGVFSSDVVFVDFVMCVGAAVELPVHHGALRLEPARPGEARPDFERWWRQLEGEHGAQTWPSFIRTRSFLLNLADALPPKRARSLSRSPALGKHHRSERAQRFQIVGRRTQLPDATSVAALRETFATGNGFNFVPVLGGATPQLGSSATWARDLQRRRGLLILRSGCGRALKADVTCLGPDTRLLDELLQQATALVHEPLEPTTELVIEPPPR